MLNRHALIAMITAVMLVPSLALGGIILQDDFDDGSVATNASGTGGPYNHGTWRANEDEVTSGTDSYYQIYLSGDYGNGGAVSYSSSWDGRFDAWTAEGVTSTVQAGKAEVVSGSVVRGIFGIADEVNNGSNQADALVPHHNRNGAIWMRLNFEQTGATGTDLGVTGSIVAAAADKDSDGGGAVDTIATFAITNWDAQDFRTFQLYVNDEGWQAYAEGDVEWTDGFTGSTTSGNLFGQTWATVNANASFTIDDPDDDSDHLDDTVFASAVANLGINGPEAKGYVRYDSWQVESGNALVPEPASMTALAIGALGMLMRRRQR